MRPFFFCTFDGFGKFEQPVGRIGTPIQQHIFHAFEQVFGNLFVDFQLAGVDDAHVEASFDRVIQERRIDRFANGVVPAEAETDVGDAAGDFRTGADLLDLFRRFEKVHGIVVVLFHAGGDREDIRIKDDIFRRKPNFLVSRS